MLIKNNKVYDWLKWAGRYGLPALATFVLTLSELLGLHELAIASAIISALVVCLNTMLGQSNENYNKLKEENHNDET